MSKLKVRYVDEAQHPNFHLRSLAPCDQLKQKYPQLFFSEKEVSDQKENCRNQQISRQ